MAGFVYLIRNGDLHKIGRTDNLQKRLKQLKPDEVVQVLETDRSRDLEYELHQQFKEKRLPQTEYFRLDEAELNAARMTLGWEPGQKVALPAPHQLDSGIAKVRDQAHVTGMTALGLFGICWLGTNFSAEHSSFALSLLMFAFVIGFLAAFGAFTFRSAQYGLKLLWFQLAKSRT